MLKLATHYSPNAWENINFNNGYDTQGWTLYRTNILKWILEEPFTSSLLDIGCCKGEYIEKIKEMGFAGFCCGLDITQSLINAASKKNLSNSQFIRGDCRNLPFMEESFDVVIFLNVIMHLPDINIISKISKLAKNTFIVSCYGSTTKAYARHTSKFLNFYYTKEDIISRVHEFTLHKFSTFTNFEKSLIFQFLFKRDGNYNIRSGQMGEEIKKGV